MSNYLLLGNLATKVIRSIFIGLDIIIYNFAKYTYSVFCYISKATLVNDDNIQLFMRRIYAILGIFMIFIFVYNLLVYIINPDKMTDSKVGASALIKDVIIALVVITMSPLLFTKLYSFQNTIIARGVISNLILGGYTADGIEIDPTDKDAGREYIEQGANDMIGEVFSTFVTVKDNSFNTTNCDNENDSNYSKYKDYCEAYNKTKSTGNIAKYESIVTKDDLYDYHWLLSTIAGVILAFFMLAFCLDLGKRVGKMAILQILAPIPLVMEILPNKKGTRKKWLEELLSTYFEVFLFQATVFIVMFLITLVPEALKEIFTNGDANFFVRTLATVFIIFGLLQFGKEVPKMITNLLGIKDSGTISKAFNRGIAMAGVTGGLFGSTIGRFARNYNATDGSAGEKLLSGLGGAGSGLARNLWGARNVHNLKDAKALRQKVNKDVVTARVQRDAYAHAHGGTIKGVMQGHRQDFIENVNATARNYWGTKNEYETYKQIDEVNTEYKKLYEQYIEKIWKNDAQYASADSDFKRYDNYKKAYIADAMNNRGMTQAQADAAFNNEIDPNTGSTYAKLLSDAKLRRDYAKAEAIKKHGKDLVEGAGYLNNFIDNHQGVKGVPTSRIDTSKAMDANGNGLVSFVGDKNNPGEIYTKVESSFKAQLDNLKTVVIDGKRYEELKVEEKIAEDAKNATKKAAEEASSGNKDKK